MKPYNCSVEAILEASSVDPETGLDNSKIKSRKQIYGSNEIKRKKKTSAFKLFINQFKSFIIYILLFAVLISLLSGEYLDTGVILAILVFNAVFGFIQEYKAEKAIEALKKLSALKAKVLRSGKITQIEKKELVPGDIIILEEGDKIPADARLIEAVNLELLESSLTGESSPAGKNTAPIKGTQTIPNQKNMVFSGTIVTRGRGKALVTSTGMQTEIGKIAHLINETPEETTPLQEKLQSLGKYIGLGTIIICLIVFSVGVAKEGLLSLLFSGQIFNFILEAKTWLLTAVSLAVAAVPEGLPAIVTIALALGVRKMVKKNALIRRLPSVETLGETTVICSDKTGTLTKNEMTVKKVFTNMKEYELTGEGYSLEGKIISEHPLTEKDLMIFKIGALCNNASITQNKNKIETTGDPTETALLISAEKSGINHEQFRQKNKRLDEDPFDSVKKMMSTLNKDTKTGKKYTLAKGAPEEILKKCDRMLIKGRVTKLSEDLKSIILERNDEFADQALRVLAFAYKPSKVLDDNNLIFAGLQAMKDPPREEVKSSIQECYDAGIKVIMVTGDNKHTAEAIAKEIGLEGNSINGSEFDSLSKTEKIKAVFEKNIFSRVEPRHKMFIVDILQKKGHIVAMTGDGINDAPALKKADIGIAMGIKGTDVSKEASDMILEDDKFSTIVDTVEEGRGIYENIRKFVNYLLSSNLAEVLIIFTAILINLPLPITAIMILWINLVTDGLPALALSVDPTPHRIMKRPPKKPEEGILNKSTTFTIIFVAALITIAVLLLFSWAIKIYSINNLAKIQTIAFTSIIVMEFVRLQAIRSEYSLKFFSNKYLILAISASILLQLAVIYTPLSIFFGTAPLNLIDWAMIISSTVLVFIINIAGNSLKEKILGEN